MLSEARSKGDIEASGKLQQMVDVLQQAGSPPEMSLIEDYLEAPDPDARRQFLEAHVEEITPEFMELLSGIVLQVQSGDDKEFASQVMDANREALRFVMQRNMNS
jgi:hypothetical protein